MQAARHRRLLRHGALLQTARVAGIVIAHNDMQLIDWLQARHQIDMPGTAVNLPNTTPTLSVGGETPARGTMQRFASARSGFDFAFSSWLRYPLVIPLASATCCRVQPFCLMALLNIK